MNEHKLSDAKRRNNKKYDDLNMSQIGIKAKKEEIEKCKDYAQKLEITPSKFALKSMLYCINNNITFDKEEK
ncbi:MAG: hypothetical protein IJT87_13370 [Ruminiclostridium sp.]|nr:hypothetical protein [Ruminiclostridium sp.]